MQASLFDPVAVAAVSAPMAAIPEPVPASSEDLIEQIANVQATPVEGDDISPLPARDETVAGILAEMALDEDCAFQPTAALYQDFVVRCRMKHMKAAPFDLATFRRRFAMAVAGIHDDGDMEWQGLVNLAGRVDDDMLAPFLMIGCAAIAGAPCPSDEAIARAYGTRSPGRVRRLLEHMERNGLIVLRTDFGGRRSIGVPDLGLSTAASDDLKD